MEPSRLLSTATLGTPVWPKSSVRDATTNNWDITKPNLDWGELFSIPEAIETAGSSRTPNSDDFETTAAVASRSWTAHKNRNVIALAESEYIAGRRANNTAKERNRVAARKCRRKKKAEQRQLEERRKSLQMQNTMLQASVAQLREEVVLLKNEVLKHGTCNFPPIQSYITATAARLQGLVPE